MTKQRGKHFLFFAAAICIISTISAPPTYSEEQKRELVLKKSNLVVLDNRFHEEIEAAGITIDDEALTGYLLSVVTKLVEFSHVQNSVYRIQIIDSPVLNAFALSDGTVYINVAILGMIDNEAQLAFLLAHEMTHIQNEHHIGLHYEMISQTSQLLYDQMFASIFGININSGYWLRSALSGFSVAQERQADSIACSVLHASGYNAWEARKFMLTMYRWLAYKENIRHKRGTSTHPKLLDRYKSTARWIEKLQSDSAQGEINESRYQETLSPYRKHIADLLLNSSCVYELTEMVKSRFAAGDSSAHWNSIYGMLLERYSPIDSFTVASRVLSKACASDAPDEKAFRTLGWLYLKNRMVDSARICLSRYRELAPAAKDDPILRFYLEHMNE